MKEKLSLERKKSNHKRREPKKVYKIENEELIQDAEVTVIQRLKGF